MISACLWKGQHLTVSSKPGCLTLSLEKDADVRVYSFDFAGRLWTSLEENRSFRHGLDGRALARWKDADGKQHREWLIPSAAEAIDGRAHRLAAEVHTQMQAGVLYLDPPLLPVDLAHLKVAAIFDAEKTAQERAEFGSIYRPIGILPPDQYMAVVLQLTEGCSFNSCTFCSLYRDQKFRVKSADEFRRHAEAVRDYLKAGISLRRTIFLGGANALVLPLHKLRPYLEIVHQLFDVEALGGIYAFLDGFSGDKKSRKDYRALADLGVDTIYIGLESGSDDLLKFLKKPASAENVLNTVRDAKEAGIAVAIIILLGAGGHTYAERHVRETIAILNKMALDGNDIIYFSKMMGTEELAYARIARAADVIPLTEYEQEQQGQSIEKGLKFDETLGTPRISVYDIRDFIF